MITLGNVTTTVVTVHSTPADDQIPGPCRLQKENDVGEELPYVGAGAICAGLRDTRAGHAQCTPSTFLNAPRELNEGRHYGIDRVPGGTELT